MKRNLTCPIVVFLFFVMLSPARLEAHALLAEDLLVNPTVVVLAAQYSGGERAAYNAVKVYGPDDKTVEHQNGRTDAEGRFAYSPNAPGLWTVVISDNMGHRIVHTTEVPAAFEQTGSTPPAAVPLVRREESVLFRLIMGCSLLSNIFFLLYFYKIKRRN